MTAPRTIGIGILGFGTVGQGVWKHLHEKQADLESRLGVKLDLRQGLRPRPQEEARGRDPGRQVATNPHEIIDDPKVHVVCRASSAAPPRPARLALRALRLGKVVVSANKALLCEHGPEIFQAVRQHGGQFLFEASVAGGIPIIKAIREGLVANRFELDRRHPQRHLQPHPHPHGRGRSLVRRRAQGSPGARATPRPTRRSTSTASTPSTRPPSSPGWRTGKWAPAARTLVEGIRKIGPADIDFARRFGFALKHLAVIRRDFKSEWMTVALPFPRP
jgi:homoserine dehydrogenase